MNTFTFSSGEVTRSRVLTDAAQDAKGSLVFSLPLAPKAVETWRAERPHRVKNIEDVFGGLEVRCHDLPLRKPHRT